MADLPLIAVIFGIVPACLLGPWWMQFVIRRRTKRAECEELATLIRQLIKNPPDAQKMTELLSDINAHLSVRHSGFWREVKKTDLPMLLPGLIASFFAISMPPASAVAEDTWNSDLLVATLAYAHYLVTFLISAACAHLVLQHRFVKAQRHALTADLPGKVARAILRDSFTRSGWTETGELLTRVNNASCKLSKTAELTRKCRRREKSLDELEQRLGKLQITTKGHEDTIRAVSEAHEDQLSGVCRILGILTGLSQSVSKLQHGITEKTDRVMLGQVQRIIENFVELLGGDELCRGVLYAKSKGRLAYPLGHVQTYSSNDEFCLKPVDVKTEPLAGVLSAGDIKVMENADLPGNNGGGWPVTMLMPIPMLKGSGDTHSGEPHAVLRVDCQTTGLSAWCKGSLGWQQTRALSAHVDSVLYASGVDEVRRFKIAKNASEAKPDADTADGEGR